MLFNSFYYLKLLNQQLNFVNLILYFLIMATFTIHTENREQLNALKAFMKAFKIKFEVSDDNSFHIICMLCVQQCLRKSTCKLLARGINTCVIAHVDTNTSITSMYLSFTMHKYPENYLLLLIVGCLLNSVFS
jgi:hypothetical protein